MKAAGAILMPVALHASLVWHDLPPLPQALAGQFVGVIGDRLVVAGGSHWDGVPAPWDGGKKIWVDTVYTLGPGETAWRLAGRLPRESGYGVAISLPGAMLCIGGQTPEGNVASAYRLTLADSGLKVESFPALPGPLANAAGALVGDTIYVAGGQASPASTTAVRGGWRLSLADPKAGWQPLPPWPGAATMLAMAAAGGDTFYLIGGTELTPDRRFLTDAFGFTPGRGWEKLPGLPRPSQAGYAIGHGGDVFVFGGNDGSLSGREAEVRERHPGFSREVYRYAVRTGQWERAGEMPASLVTSGIVKWRDEYVIAGGEDRPGHRSARVIALRLDDAGPEKAAIFVGKTGGYEGYRIPALVTTTKGSVLAFCAARKALSDWEDIDIAMRRSTDGGKTWEPQRIIADRGASVVDNPTPIVDRVTGAVHFLFQVNYAQLFYMRSDDDGRTFSSPVEITDTVHGFRRGWVANATASRYGWSVVAPGPGHGIQLASGRLLAPIWMSPHYMHRPSAIATIYSDDHGKTWQRGEVVSGDLLNPSEHVAVELAGGGVMLNIRSEEPGHLRGFSISKDGISGWSKPQLSPDLFEPVCMASLIRVGKDRLVFANPDSRGRAATPRNYNMLPRENLTIRLSTDEGKSWPVARVLEPGPVGYSDMAPAPGGAVYILYERVEGGRHNLNFARFTLDWLTGGAK